MTPSRKYTLFFLTALLVLSGVAIILAIGS